MSTPPDAPDQQAAEGLQLPTSWPDMAGVPIVFANQIGVGSDGNEVVLTFGQVYPKPISAQSQEEWAKAMAELGTLTIQPVARIVISTARARELLGLLKLGFETGDET